MRQRLLSAATVTAALGTVLSYPSEARADVVVPMISVIEPILGLAIVPIILVEAEILKSVLGLERRRAIRASVLANAVSTCAGVPLTWAILVGLDRNPAFTWKGPGYEYDWTLPSACLFLTLPFFVVSLWCERIVCARILKEVPSDLVQRAVFVANASTYGVLALASSVWLGCSIRAAG